MKKPTKTKNKFLIYLFLVFQVFVFLNFSLTSKLIPSKNQFLYADSGQKPAWLWSRANFDGVHYLEIAQKGYGLYQQAFFPLFPRLIRFSGDLLGGRFLLAGFLISFFSLWGALRLLYLLLRLDWPEKIAKKTLLYLLIFPTAFYFTSLYTESLFLFFVLLSFYLARKKKWFLAPLVVALASATRVVGIFLLPALLLEAWQQKSPKKSPKKFLKNAFWLILISPLGLLTYMRFLAKNFADPLLFVHVQPYFGAQRSGGGIILLYQVFWRYLRMIITCQKNSPLYFTVWLELLSTLLFLALLLFAYFKKVNRSYLLFAVLALITPTLSGTFSSMPRYVLVLFPGFIALSLLSQKKPLLGKAYLVLGFILSFACQLLFSQGYWVS
jgi:hypothetical protein